MKILDPNLCLFNINAVSCFIYVHFWKRKLKPMIFQIQKHSLKTHHKSHGWIYKQAAMRRGGHNPTDIEVPKSNQNIIKFIFACITQWNLSKSGHNEYQHCMCLFVNNVINQHKSTALAFSHDALMWSDMTSWYLYVVFSHIILSGRCDEDLFHPLHNVQ